MRRLAALLTLALALAGPADAQGAHDPVYVGPGTELSGDAAAQGRLRLRIVDRALGRIRIVVVRRGSARDIARRIGRELELRGALLVLAGTEAHVITSYDPAGPAIQAVERAFASGGGLERQLRRAIDGLADVDPGPSGDDEPAGAAGTPPTIVLPDVEGVADDVTGTVRAVFFGVFAFIAAVLLLVAFVLWRRHRAAQEATEEELADLRAEIGGERDLLGQDIVELDAMTAFGGGARAAYERALDAYERSEVALDRADNRRRMEAARRLVAEGRAAAQRARVGSG